MSGKLYIEFFARQHINDGIIAVLGCRIVPAAC